ncbi:hypothetical protein HF086_005372 [Spodoptera exigua]|uniref:Major facilitator superfamily (MFS) profile domain-containing protein n=1 Tax=Spodoptera exigua TaxID=7107 RepID=A0A922MMZ2_SPOEX|nr:hypothetical protein HF086_005372 [Spodoptera exigua]
MTLMLMAMQTLSGCFALMNYAADVFHRAGTQWSPNTLALAVGSLQLAGSFFTTISIEKFGRKVNVIFLRACYGCASPIANH